MLSFTGNLRRVNVGRTSVLNPQESAATMNGANLRPALGEDCAWPLPKGSFLAYNRGSRAELEGRLF
jgi:hypothetical protein